MHHLNIDIETYSPEPLKKTGLYKYAQSPNFQILLFGYSLDGAPAQTIDLTQPNTYIPQDILRWMFDPQCIKHAFNAAFEWNCLSRYFGLDSSANSIWTPEYWLPQWHDTQLHALYCGYPISLKAVGTAMGLPEDKQKLRTGDALIRYFCVPCKPTKANGGRSRNLPQHDPAKWDLFKTYNIGDVVAEQEMERRLSAVPVPDAVQRQWEQDQIINLRGVAADRQLVEGAVQIGSAVHETQMQEARELTGLANPNSRDQLLAWLNTEIEEDVPDVRKNTVNDLLAQGVPSDKATRMLELRQELSKTSTKKYNAIETCVCADGRIRGMMQFYGANRTGREAGRLVQVQNLPHDTVPAEQAARELVKTHNLDGLRAVYGNVPQALSALIRTSLIAAPGMTFVDADFSAIEARVISWLSGEEWALDVFRTTGKIYETTAAQMFGIPVDKIKKGNPEYAYRKKGKVATLALGYQGGKGALINMRKTLGMTEEDLPEADMPDIVRRWRNANLRTVQFWYDINNAAYRAVTSGQATTVGRVTVAREIYQNVGLDFMTILLPCGRKLYYPGPHIGKNHFGEDSILYGSWDNNAWKPTETYGGKLVENITQAVARDCLFYAMQNLTAAGYRIVFDIHDEIVIEVPAGMANLDKIVEIMSQPIPWAPGLPLNADGWVGNYFRKD